MSIERNHNESIEKKSKLKKIADILVVIGVLLFFIGAVISFFSSEIMFKLDPTIKSFLLILVSVIFFPGIAFTMIGICINTNFIKREELRALKKEVAERKKKVRIILYVVLVFIIIIAILTILGIFTDWVIIEIK